ncbi:MAG: helix-turn-helix domain-containing protein [Chloroflexi bacterium]|nr:helix-turn-helix domain-containing protein [Chloroflexota bacterium]
MTSTDERLASASRSAEASYTIAQSGHTLRPASEAAIPGAADIAPTGAHGIEVSLPSANPRRGRSRGADETRGAARNRRKLTAPLKTVDKALSIVDFLGVFGGRVGVRELAENLGLGRSVTHRLLLTLERHAYVVQDPHTGKYQLGPRLFEVGAAVHSQLDLRATARPHLRRLADQTGDVVHLAVENGNSCVYLEKIEGRHAIEMGSQVGWRRPLFCTGIGKVLLAFSSADRLERFLGEQAFERLTPHTIADPAGLRVEFAAVRVDGVAYDREEIELGLRCVAAPIWRNGQVIAGISVAGSSERFGPDRLEWLAQVVRDGAGAIERDLNRETDGEPDGRASG